MGLFKAKQPAGSPVDGAATVTQEVFTEQYREELRQIGRQHLKDLIDASASTLHENINATMKQVAGDLKEHLTRQLDVMVAGANTEITNQLNERINEYNRIASDAQELAAQTLTRNSQAVYEKYQQFSATMQQTIASQEVQMITVLQDSKRRMATAQAEQDEELRSLREMNQASQHETEQIHQEMRQAVARQAAQLDQIHQENLMQLSVAKDTQAATLGTLQASSQAVEQQHQQLTAFLDKSLADQKAMLIGAVNENMARIIEHYLVGALGEQSDLKSQLPSILDKMEENKQAMAEDMAL